ncbi:hypothetical protein JKP88DRAFT_263291 [Tribonema minus]|uniref:General stress protein FMN-binding split barrel domain-containing protein n=1 Tax=Tribonema minus TaxID=303371 RepID=A0A836CD97_9STRA|nr:hypothetical protein JKP88DRAFT_263291 [Tribonema minus]
MAATGSFEKQEKFWELVTQFHDCMLVTKDKNTGQLRSRPMAPRVSKTRKQILFITEKNSVKTDEIDSCQDVALAFIKAGNWVSVSGKAHILSDRELVSAIWDKEMDTWMAQGKDDPNVVVLAVDPQMAEYWDVTANKMTQAYEFAAARMGMKERPDVSENVKVDLEAS